MRDFFANLFKCTSETMIERVKNPIVGSFIFSWLFFNWKVILILLFSDKEIDDKINSISALISYKSFLFPLVFAFLYSVLLPAFSLCIDILLKPIFRKVVNIRTDREVDEYESRQKTGRKRADAELAYELQKTGGLEKIQRMQEEITASKDREGALVKERDNVIDEMNKILEENKMLREKYNDILNKLKKIEKENLRVINENFNHKNKNDFKHPLINDYSFNKEIGDKYNIIVHIIELLGLETNSFISDADYKHQDLLISSMGNKDISNILEDDMTIFDFLSELDMKELFSLEKKLS